jgi:hypothetical protein
VWSDDFIGIDRMHDYDSNYDNCHNIRFNIDYSVLDSHYQ